MQLTYSGTTAELRDADGAMIASIHGRVTGRRSGKWVTEYFVDASLRYAFDLRTLKYSSEEKAIAAVQQAVDTVNAMRVRDNGAASMNAALLDAQW